MKDIIDRIKQGLKFSDKTFLDFCKFNRLNLESNNLFMKSIEQAIGECESNLKKISNIPLYNQHTEVSFNPITQKNSLKIIRKRTEKWYIENNLSYLKSMLATVCLFGGNYHPPEVEKKIENFKNIYAEKIQWTKIQDLIKFIETSNLNERPLKGEIALKLANIYSEYSNRFKKSNSKIPKKQFLKDVYSVIHPYFKFTWKENNFIKTCENK